MRTSISRVTSNGTPTSDIVSAEVSFLSEVLGNLRDSGKISNEAYLDAGTIQGGLSIVANLMLMLASRPDSEISPLILCTRFGEPILLNNVLGGAQEINQIRIRPQSCLRLRNL